MSSGPARYEVSGERRKPKPSCSTSRVPSPKIASPFLAWCLRSANTSSCLRRRLAPSSSLAIAMSTSSVTCFSLRSERCIAGGGPPGSWRGTSPGDLTGRKTATAGKGVCGTCGLVLRLSDVAVNEGGELRLGKRPHLLRLERAVLEEHERRDAAHVVL